MPCELNAGSTSKVKTSSWPNFSGKFHSKRGAISRAKYQKVIIVVYFLTFLVRERALERREWILPLE